MKQAPKVPLNSEKTWRLVQVTDPHLGPTRDYCLAGIETYESFRQILAELGSRHPVPDMIYATGDIAASGAPEAYQLFTQQMQFLDIPYGWLPGNHDDLNIMQEGLSSASYWPVLELGHWRAISLDTSMPGEVGGALQQKELSFLESALKAEPDNSFILFMHHPPLPVGSEWLDKQRISNAEDLKAVVASCANVKAIFSGHVHQEFIDQWAGCDVYTTPSTCFQFLPDNAGFALSDQLPGYRWIDLRPDGSLDTGVVHLKESSQSIDHNVVGY